jgi:RimJ/RimL family protein N-acetyltransferase
VNDGAPPLVPTLSDGTVTLRGYVTADTNDVVAYARDPLVQKWTALPSPYTRRDAESFLANCADGWRRGAGRSFAIETQGRWCGGIDIRPATGGVAEVGYGLAPWARGSGVAVRAMRLALPWAFSTLNLSVIQWEAHVGNWASRRAAWACGFQVEGALTAFVDARGTRADAWYGVLRRDDPMTPAHPWHDPVTVRGQSVVLRAHSDQDVARMVEAAADERTQHWLADLPHPYTIDAAAAHLLRIRSDAAAGRRLGWALADPDSDVLIGEIGIFMHEKTGLQNEMGYWMHPDARGRGVMTEATRMAARHALLPAEEGGLGMGRVFIRTGEFNHASRHVAVQAGFTQVGVDRHATPLRDGTIGNDIRYDLLASELPVTR